MMKKIISALLLYGAILPAVFSQDIDYFLSYYPGIYKAEKFILDSAYQNALDTYKETFNKVPFIFGKDYYNAAVCAILTKQNRDAFVLLEKLAEQGLSLPWLTKQPVVQPLKKEKAWKKFENKYPELRKIFYAKFDQKLKKELLALDSLDQFFRKKENAYNLYMDTIDKIDQFNAIALKKIMDEKGYPGEIAIGILDSITARCPGDLVIIHQASTILNYETIIDFNGLVEHAKRGRFSPHTAAYLLDSKADAVPFFLYTSIGLCKAIQSDPTVMNSEADQLNDAVNKEKLAVVKYSYRKREGKALEVFNAQRNSMGLEPAEEFRKKVYLGQIATPFYFQYTGGILTFEFNHEGEMQNFMKPLVEFEYR